MPRQPYLLQTRRLGFRRYILGDAVMLRAVFSDPYAARFYPAMNTTAALERWVDGNLQSYEAHGFGLWAMELLDSGVLIGDAGITYQTVEGKRIHEVGWHVHSGFRCQGYATEAAQACMSFGFTHVQAPVLGSIVDPANTASFKVAARVHHSRRAYSGKSGPMFLFSTTAAEFAARPALR